MNQESREAVWLQAFVTEMVKPVGSRCLLPDGRLWEAIRAADSALREAEALCAPANTPEKTT